MIRVCTGECKGNRTWVTYEGSVPCPTCHGVGYENIKESAEPEGVFPLELESPPTPQLGQTDNASAQAT